MTRRGVWVRFLLYPTHTLPTAAAPVLIAAALAARQQALSPGVLLVAFLGSWLIHVGGVLADNHELLLRHGDVPEHPELLDSLHDGSLRPGHLRWAIAGCFLAGCAPAPWLVSIGGPPVLVIGAVGVLSSLGYGMGLRYARFGLADPIFFVMFGIVAVVGGSYIQLAEVRGTGQPWTETLRQMPWQTWVVGLPCGALVTAVLVIDDIRDRDFDARKGWRTTAVRFGLRGSRRLFVALYGFAYGLPLALWAGGLCSPWILLCWLTLPLAVRIARQVTRLSTTAELLGATPQASFLALGHSATLALGLLRAW